MTMIRTCRIQDSATTRRRNKSVILHFLAPISGWPLTEITLVGKRSHYPFSHQRLFMHKKATVRKVFCQVMSSLRQKRKAVKRKRKERERLETKREKPNREKGRGPFFEWRGRNWESAVIRSVRGASVTSTNKNNSE